MCQRLLVVSGEIDSTNICCGVGVGTALEPAVSPSDGLLEFTRGITSTFAKARFNVTVIRPI
eukprot:CAMPEP_0113724068 /NCGR_PEP_ID=MMETSP0038_2-20120614/38836_1 /TAXON_ID=2898 /ORGANISM="Cryptomonas paramecium" /LENGTH=61 /DNA_ID=CAMNT_0000653853 /DNA_START=398 /DNA_END=583 /DNA_ORIENTATION=+ /assembly_acc=CAM_ASM_000170